MKSLRLWMRVLGALYVFVFLAAAVLRLPIQAEGPAGLLARAAAHDPTAMYVVDTWTMFGLFMGAVGVALLVFSREPEAASTLVWTVLGLEAAGVATDVTKLAHGYAVTPPLVWMAIHGIAVVSGYLLVRGARLAVSARSPSV